MMTRKQFEYDFEHETEDLFCFVSAGAFINLGSHGNYHFQYYGKEHLLPNRPSFPYLNIWKHDKENNYTTSDFYIKFSDPVEAFAFWRKFYKLIEQLIEITEYELIGCLLLASSVISPESRQNLEHSIATELI